MTESNKPPVSDSDIAVVGLAGRFPGARTVAEFWNNVRDGVESLTLLSEEELAAAGVPRSLIHDPAYVNSAFMLPDMEMFDAAFFGLSPKDAAIMDPQHRHFLECAWTALEDAGHAPGTFDGTVGVFAGCGASMYLMNNLLTNPDLVRNVGFFLLRHTGNDKDFLATRVSYALDLRGPSVNVQTACSTSLVAIHLACQSLLGAECDIALAGGVTIKQPHRIGYLYKEGEILSPDGHCRAFDAKSEGTVFGSGVGVVALRRLSDALTDGDTIYAVVKGSAINNDGAGKVGYLAPSVDGQAGAIAEALAISGVDASTIGYVETHGTGTPVGDPIEIAALAQAFGGEELPAASCAIGSLKPNTGHLDTASGVASFMKVVEALRHRQLPPSLHFETPNPALGIESTPFYVNGSLREWPAGSEPRRAGVSSLGAGGTNAHVILEEAPAPLPSGPSRDWQLLTLSAKTPEALERACAKLATHLRAQPEQPFADVAWTQQVGRRAFKHRRTVVARSGEDAASQLDELDQKRTPVVAAPDDERSVAFMFAGGGAQYAGMGAELYRDEPVFREAVDRCLTILRKHVDTDLSRLLFTAPEEREEATARLESPSLALPALFTVQYAQAKLWMSWGVQPSAMIGHSMGEYTAAHLAGVFSLEDALALVALRGRLFERIPAGGMLSVSLSAEELAPLLGPELSIAAINAPELCAASGPLHAIEELERRLAEREVECRRIHIAIAAHSAMLEPILGEFGSFCGRIALQAPRMPIISNVTGTWMTASQATDPQYWVRHLRHTVRFAEGIGTLAEDASRILLEVGPGRTLATLAGMHPTCRAERAIVSSMRHPDDETPDTAFMIRVLGLLWMHGAAIDFRLMHAGEKRQRVPIPTYSFERARHWIEPGEALSISAGPEEALRKRDEIADWCYLPSWRRSIRPTPPAVEGGTSAPVLLFHDEHGIGRQLASSLRTAGRTVTSVLPGDRFARTGDDAFVVRPGSAEDHEALVTSLLRAEGVPAAIVHAWSACDSRDAQAEDYTSQRDRGFFSPLFLAQAMAKEDVTTPVSLTLLSTNMHRVAGEATLEPMKAMLLGPARVIGKEFASIRSRSVDIALPAGATLSRSLLDQLIAEIETLSDDEVVALRGPDRWVESFESVPLPAAREGWPALATQGVVLITGGLGGIALEIAEQLAKEGARTLVLIGRSALPPREQWARRIAAGGDDRQSRQLRRISAIEELGASVEVVSADVTSPSRMRAVVEDVRTRLGEITLVIHAAGVLADGLIADKSPEEAERVIAPKILGAIALDEALGEDSEALLVLFSSRGAVTGPVGQVDYTAANAALDSFAQARMARGASTVSINWGTWQGVGMTAAPPGPRPVAHPLLAECISESESSATYVAKLDPARHWLLDEHRINGAEALLPGTGYLELVRAAFADRSPGDSMELSDVFFLAPFVVPQGRDGELRVSLASGDSVNEFVIEGRVSLDDDRRSAWQEHARGSICRGGSAPDRRADLQELLSRCRRSSKVFEGHESRLEHLVLGARWANLRRIDYGDGEAVASLEIPAQFAEETRDFHLHPAILDVATACAQALIEGYDPHDDFYVPVSYGSLRAYGTIPARSFSHIRYRPSDDGSRDVAVFDITLVDDSGRVVVEVAEFTMMRVADRGRAIAGIPVAASSEEDEILPQSADPIEGILAEEGVEVLRRILSLEPPPSQIVVSPQDLVLWTRHLRNAGRPVAAATGAAASRRAAERVIEVEQHLGTHEALSDCVVLAREDRPGMRRLVAYLVRDVSADATVSEIRRFLRDRVPEELVPQHFVELDELPRLGDGAVDLHALPDPFAAADDHVAPRTPTERAIAEVWQELLGVARIGVHDNFLDVGGHSLLAMRALAKIAKKTGVRLGPSAMNLQTLEQIAAECDRRQAPAAPAPLAAAPAAAAVAAPAGGMAHRLFSAVRQKVTRV